MKAKFAGYAAAAFIAGGLLASSAFVPAQAASTHPKLSPGHYAFDAYETATTTGGCPFSEGGVPYKFYMVYSSSGNSTIRFTPVDDSGSEVTVLSIPKKTGSGTWSATYSGKSYNQSGTVLSSWTGSFSATGTPADTESIALVLSLTNIPDSASGCTAIFNASGAMTGTGN